MPNIIDLSITDKKEFLINNDPNRKLYLNVSDMGILPRFTEAESKLYECQNKVAKLLETTKEDSKEVVKVLTDIDNEMRELVDFIFDAPVSSVCAPNGSMFDPFNGTFRYIIIIEALLSEYDENLENESKRMEEVFKAHTEKYSHGGK